MKTAQIDAGPDIGHPIPPAWWEYFWIICAFDMAMIMLMFVLPDYAALWTFLFVSVSAGLGLNYWIREGHHVDMG